MTSGKLQPDRHTIAAGIASDENQRGLNDLKQDFPGYRIWQEPMGSQIRLVAVRREPGTGPHTLVTADLIELRAALAKSTPATTGRQTSAAQGHR
jgi:hypothetical protein